jgi:aminoglycoside phosphotransferase (APT) family kinase protein
MNFPDGGRSIIMFRIFKEKSFTQIEPINKGWSSDKKYCVTKANGKKYLFRISPLEKYELKKHDYEMMQRVASLGVPMCQPIEFVMRASFHCRAGLRVLMQKKRFRICLFLNNINMV